MASPKSDEQLKQTIAQAEQRISSLRASLGASLITLYANQIRDIDDCIKREMKTIEKAKQTLKKRVDKSA